METYKVKVFRKYSGFGEGMAQTAPSIDDSFRIITIDDFEKKLGSRKYSATKLDDLISHKKSVVAKADGDRRLKALINATNNKPEYVRLENTIEEAVEGQSEAQRVLHDKKPGKLNKKYIVSKLKECYQVKNELYAYKRYEFIHKTVDDVCMLLNKELDEMSFTDLQWFMERYQAIRGVEFSPYPHYQKVIENALKKELEYKEALKKQKEKDRAAKKALKKKAA